MDPGILVISLGLPGFSFLVVFFKVFAANLAGPQCVGLCLDEMDDSELFLVAVLFSKLGTVPSALTL